MLKLIEQIGSKDLLYLANINKEIGESLIIINLKLKDYEN